MCEEGDLVAKDFGVSCLNKKGGNPMEIAKERRYVGVREVLVDIGAEQALDGVERVIGFRRRQVVEGLQ